MSKTVRFRETQVTKEHLIGNHTQSTE